MNATGDESMELLRVARKARDDARAAGAVRSPAYAVGQGLACAAGFSALGLADVWPGWSAWLLGAGVLALAGFLVLLWAGVHHGGTTPWFGQRRRWVASLVPIGVGFLAWVPYGPSGWLVAFGVASGVEYVMRGVRTGAAQ